MTTGKKSYRHYTDLFKSGEEEGFNHFFRKYYSSLCIYASKIISESDVAQEIASTAFLKIWQKRQQFDSEGGIKSYLYKIVYNDCLKHIKYLKKKNESETEVFLLHSYEQELDHFQNLVKAETCRQLEELIRTLSPQCAKVFEMLYIEEKTAREVAEELGISISTVKTQKARGLVLIRERFRIINS